MSTDLTWVLMRLDSEIRIFLACHAFSVSAHATLVTFKGMFVIRKLA